MIEEVKEEDHEDPKEVLPVEEKLDVIVEEKPVVVDNETNSEKVE